MSFESAGETRTPDGKSSNSQPSFYARLKRFVFGDPRDLGDVSIFHRASLIPMLAWVGLGADGLSSSCYGPQEAWIALGQHTYLAVGLAILTTFTVIILSASYGNIIEEFPHGGGGYVVVTKLLSPKLGVTSGCALLVDYLLTISVSVAASGDALFSLLPPFWHSAKFPFEVIMILGLTTINIRGVKESVLALSPIFLVFVVTHLILICGGVIGHAGELPATARNVSSGFSHGLATIGVFGICAQFARAYSLGGGTYTGIEAVSNGLPIMRDPKVQSAKRTMLYMAASLSFTAGGLIVCYLLWNVGPVAGKTMNAVLTERMFGGFHYWGRSFLIATLVSEAFLLVVAAQAGFIDGPRVLANMAIDSWVPRRYASLSERLTMRDGVLSMGVMALVTLFITGGKVESLVVIYSLHVFLTFSLSMLSMTRLYYRRRTQGMRWKRKFIQFAFSFVLCVAILVVMIVEKFKEGAWLTLGLTGIVIYICILIKDHYQTVGAQLSKLYSSLESRTQKHEAILSQPDPSGATAVILVGGYGGLGIHTVDNILKAFPDMFKNLIFVSIGVVDSGIFKGLEAVEGLRISTKEALDKYVALAKNLGIAATSKFSIGTDVVEEAEKLCLDIAHDFPKSTFFAGKLIFRNQKWYHRILHNETAFAIEKRMQMAGKTMVILPVKAD